MTPAQRQAAILGDGPRLAPLQPEEVGPDLAAMLTRRIAINAAVVSREAETLTDIVIDDPNADLGALLQRLPDIMRTMLRHPTLFNCLIDTGLALLANGVLPARDRELAILRIAWLTQAPYEWGEHVIIAKKVGVTTEEVEAVTIGSTAPVWTDHDRAILRAAEELHADATITDATWAILAATYEDRQLIELPVVIGQYQAVAYYQNALRLSLHHDNPGLTAR